MFPIEPTFSRTRNVTVRWNGTPVCGDAVSDDSVKLCTVNRCSACAPALAGSTATQQRQRCDKPADSNHRANSLRASNGPGDASG